MSFFVDHFIFIYKTCNTKYINTKIFFYFFFPPLNLLIPFYLKIIKMNPTEESKFKICTQCNKKVISFPNNFCRKQFLSSIDNETSGNINLDEFIKKTQLNSKFCDDFIEWIPYSNFENIKYLTSGGNSKIYFGNWLLNKSLASMSSLNVVLKVIRISDSLKEVKYVNNRFILII